MSAAIIAQPSRPAAILPSMLARSTDRNARRGFTLVELLVVIGIIAVLIAMLLPALTAARAVADRTACLSNLRNLGQALLMYNHDNDGWNIPSYTMTGTDGGADVPLEGWACILDRDGYIKGKRENNGSVFVCPSMVDIEGMKDGQTGSDPEKPKGWMDWPNVRLGVANVPMTIPDRGFNRIIRVGYWINADNPIGKQEDTVVADLYYTSSVGYGPAKDGRFLRPTRFNRIRHPSRMIVLADGVYAGRQRDGRLGMPNCRIGYRHKIGGIPAANVLFADGHADLLEGTRFPRGKGGANTLADVREDNGSSNPTIYADPQWALK